MTTSATLVVQFGEGADSSALVVVELDDTRNGGKTTFQAGDIVYFILHHSPVLRVGNIAWTDGQVVAMGTTRLSRTVDQSFTDTEPQSLNYIPAGAVSVVWQGRQSAYTVVGNQVTVADPPVIGKLSFEIDALLYQLISPATMVMDENNSYAISVVFTMEAA